MSACFLLCAFLGGICSDVQSGTAARIPKISLSLSHRTLIKVQNKTFSWQSWLEWRGHLSNTPSLLYNSLSNCGVWLGLVTSVIIAIRFGSSKHSSSVSINGLPVGIAFPHWAVSFIPISFCRLSSWELVCYSRSKRPLVSYAKLIQTYGGS